VTQERKRDAYKTFGEYPEGKIQSEKPTCRWKHRPNTEKELQRQSARV
jgi:hypothetical protein